MIHVLKNLVWAALAQGKVRAWTLVASKIEWMFLPVFPVTEKAPEKYVMGGGG